MPNLHQHYDILDAAEREFVADTINAVFALRRDRADEGRFAPPLFGDDRAERAADALARWVIESRT